MKENSQNVWKCQLYPIGKLIVWLIKDNSVTFKHIFNFVSFRYLGSEIVF